MADAEVSTRPRIRYRISFTSFCGSRAPRLPCCICAKPPAEDTGKQVGVVVQRSSQSAADGRSLLQYWGYSWVSASDVVGTPVPIALRTRQLP